MQVDALDLGIMAGLALLVLGAWLLAEFAGLALLAGILLIVFSIILARRRSSGASNEANQSGT